MPKEFKKVDANDFMTFSKDPPPHLQIEGYIMELGGGGKNGVEYKMKLLKAAGWKHHALTSYGAHADTATVAFNNIRQVLMKTDDRDQILDKLRALTADSQE